jgi:hydrogenase maturation protease
VTKEPTIPLLVLGLGNVLCADDAVGVEAVRRLNHDYVLPEGMLALDGGTLGLSLLPWVQDARNLILVDAIATGAPPGTFVRLEGDEVPPAAAHRLSPHQFGVSDLLDGANWVGRVPEKLVLVGLAPATIELCKVGITPAVEAEIDALVSAVIAEANALGFEPRPRAPEARREEPAWR